VPVPDGLPTTTGNAPTFRTTRQTAATATNQLDYVFASRGFHESIWVRALNAVDERGPSDHCRIHCQCPPGIDDSIIADLVRQHILQDAGQVGDQGNSGLADGRHHACSCL